MELYMEQLLDLLHPTADRDPPRIKMRAVAGKNPTRHFDPEGVTKVKVETAMEAIEVVAKATQRRMVRATMMSACSSRGHEIIRVFLKAGDTNAALTLIDLAGSEHQQLHFRGDERGNEQRVRPTLFGNAAAGLKEAATVNKAIRALGVCIEAAAASAEQKPCLVPVRDSHLTMLMADALRGTTRLALIANVSLHPNSADETASTLGFATLCGKLPYRFRWSEEVHLHLPAFFRRRVVAALAAAAQCLPSRLWELLFFALGTLGH